MQEEKKRCNFKLFAVHGAFPFRELSSATIDDCKGSQIASEDEEV